MFVARRVDRNSTITGDSSLDIILFASSYVISTEFFQNLHSASLPMPIGFVQQFLSFLPLLPLKLPISRFFFYIYLYSNSLTDRLVEFLDFSHRPFVSFLIEEIYSNFSRLLLRAVDRKNASERWISRKGCCLDSGTREIQLVTKGIDGRTAGMVPRRCTHSEHTLNTP